MHISRLDLNLFVVLDAIYTEGNITRAARTLNLTQPALSHALGRLRRVFDDPLFIRQGSAMMPTPMVRSLIGPVRQSLKTLAASVQQAKAFDPAAAQRTFTIGFRDVMEARILRPLMAWLDREAPGVEIASVRIEGDVLESDLAGGVLDLAVEVLRPGLSSRVQRMPLTRDELVVVAGDGHPALAGGLNLDRYLAAGHVLVSSRRSGIGLEDVELARLGHQRRVRLRCQQYYAACRVAAETELLLTMPGQYARMINRGLATTIHPFPLPVPPVTIYLYWHEQAALDPANQWVRGVLGALMAEQDRP
ncbi:LysR family transcriptional regulator [Xanthobacter versatilis]|uniref:LysR family transcriptional regulator n=1 Tax=Xanthobacter autotrophicus (strain ATCC BAA-1158 / Py2) TaxID=78245 RepID=UPI00372BA660